MCGERIEEFGISTLTAAPEVTSIVTIQTYNIRSVEFILLAQEGNTSRLEFTSIFTCTPKKEKK